MTEITFIQDYRGVLTDETYYLSGTVAQLPDGQAVALVEAGRAEYVDKPEQTDYESMTVVELRAALKEAGESTVGNKAELITRIGG